MMIDHWDFSLQERLMLPDLESRLFSYVASFNAFDEELNIQEIDNAHAFGFLLDQIPLVDLPDKDIERTYYFRWWVLRKHWKKTPQGHILTEFLPPVPWAGPYNSINAAVGHHLREARWMRNAGSWIQEYIEFFLNGVGDAYKYSMWLISAIDSFCQLQPDDAFLEKSLFQSLVLYSNWEKKRICPCGLFWSEDNYDAMEYSISGSGIRPTLNSYMYGDACAISRMAFRLGQKDIGALFEDKASRIKENMDRFLWHEGFYKVIPCEKKDADFRNGRPAVDNDHNAREQIGYIPWYFDMPDDDKSQAFSELMNPDGFLSASGITTAEKRHPRYLFQHDHECLWNGYVWPFATSQTLTALGNALRHKKNMPLTKDSYTSLLRQYAISHQLRKSNGTIVPWIDENLHPDTGVWQSRKELEADHWNPLRGGYERGKDYNHSTFCDLVLSGLLGIDRRENEIISDPIIPDDWDYFCVTGLFKEKATIVYDKTGQHYGLGKGLFVIRPKYS